jgi:ABC-type glycerol-3-phosphate transport system substrate-binding protein
MKISLFQGILLGVFGFGALIGLFVFATQTSNTGNTAGPVVIWGELSEAGMQDVLATAVKDNPMFKSVSYTQKDPATLASDLSAAIATGNAPDMVLASQEELYTLRKFIEPIPLSTLPLRTFTNTFVELGNIFAAPNDGGYYGIPFLVDPLALFSNRTILSSSGIAKPPATWEALTGLVPKVALLTSSKQITRGLIALGTYDNVRNARGILSSLFLQTGIRPSSYSANGALSVNLSNAGSNARPGQAVLGFYTQFADPSKVSYTWNASLTDSGQAFLVGDLALHIGYVSEARFLKAANPNLNFAVAPLPQPATATGKSVYGLVYAFMIPRGARNAAGAYQVASLLTNQAEQASAAAATGLAPATLAELANVPADPTAAVAYAEALYASGWLSPAPADTDAVFSGMIGGVISGRSTPETALTNAERSLSQLLQQ